MFVYRIQALEFDFVQGGRAICNLDQLLSKSGSSTFATSKEQVMKCYLLALLVDCYIF